MGKNLHRGLFRVDLFCRRVSVCLGALALSACVHPKPAPVDPRLPAWTDAMSDGCTVPLPEPFKGALFSDAERACCVAHDHRYYLGGSPTDRLNADTELAQCIERVDAGRMTILGARAKARIMFDAVREFGAPSLEVPKVSWGWGWPDFAYTDHPREERH